MVDYITAKTVPAWALWRGNVLEHSLVPCSPSVDHIDIGINNQFPF
jgi:hypothetical protein